MGGLLSQVKADDERAVVQAIAESAREIAELLRDGGAESASKEGNTNAFGDAQLQIDVRSDELIRRRLRNTKMVRMVSSEEQPEETILNEGGEICVAYDPLDGSSVVGCNFAVGSIFAVWRAQKFHGVCGKDMILAAAAVYGPRATLFVCGSAWPNGGVSEISLRPSVPLSSFTVRRLPLLKNDAQSLQKKMLFAPANLRASQDLPGYQQLVEYYLKHRYTLRYTGAMVPDVTQILVKGHGVFVSPISEKAPAKLRLLYEAIPMAALIEAAGGQSSDGHSSILHRVIQHCEQRTAVCLGSKTEVTRFEKYCSQTREE